MLRMMRRLSGGKPSNSHAVPATESPLCRADCPLQLDGPFLDLHVRRVDIDAVAGPDTLVHHPDADIHAPLQDIVSPRQRPSAAVPALLIIWSIFLTCASATAPVSSFMRKLNPMVLRSPTCTPVRFGVCPWSCSAKARQYSSSSSVTTNPPSPRCSASSALLPRRSTAPADGSQVARRDTLRSAARRACICAAASSDPGRSLSTRSCKALSRSHFNEFLPLPAFGPDGHVRPRSVTAPILA